jgi:hemerythrin-like domain-containing protein
VKRSEALASLSRDHHQALVVAQQLRRATAADAARARTRFLDFWRRDGHRHFQLEEEILLPGYAAHGDPYDPVVLRVLGDHVAIRQRANQLATGPDEPDPDTLHGLGERLAAHVRLEERELFPAIEQAMPPDELTALAQALDDPPAGAISP